MATITDERLAEMLVEVQDEMESAVADAEYDQNPQLAIDAVGEFDLAEMRSALTELQSLRSQAGVSEEVAWGVWLNDGRFMDIASSSKDDATEMGRVHYEDDQFHVRPLFARPAPIEITEALRNLVEDISDRFDMDSPSTNPGMKAAVADARAALQGETK